MIWFDFRSLCVASVEKSNRHSQRWPGDCISASTPGMQAMPITPVFKSNSKPQRLILSAINLIHHVGAFSVPAPSSWAHKSAKKRGRKLFGAYGSSEHGSREEGVA